MNRELTLREFLHMLLHPEPEVKKIVIYLFQIWIFINAMALAAGMILAQANSKIDFIVLLAILLISLGALTWFYMVLAADTIYHYLKKVDSGGISNEGRAGDQHN